MKQLDQQMIICSSTEEAHAKQMRADAVISDCANVLLDYGSDMYAEALDGMGHTDHMHSFPE